MSADNGIYIAEFPDGWRVIEAQAIENLTYNDGNEDNMFDGWNITEVQNYFKNVPLLSSKEEAQKRAFEMEAEICRSECPILEYGISTLGYIPVHINNDAKEKRTNEIHSVIICPWCGCGFKAGDTSKW